MQISKGQRLPLSKFLQSNIFQIELSITGITVDFSAFGLNSAKQLANDDYMVFYNQLKTPCNGLSVSLTHNSAIFSCDLNKIPASIETLSLTAAIDGSQTMSQISTGCLKFLENGREIANFSFNGSDFSNEKALMLGDIYRKNGEWRFNAVGQGFNGGLSALLKHFGGEEDTTTTSIETIQQAPQTTLQLSKALSLEKKLEKKAPQLLSLVKKLNVSLEKAGLQDHQAKVALCLDVSGSMYPLYSEGIIQKFVERILALGCRFDDDGSIDIFLFADKACVAGEMGVDNFKSNIIDKMIVKNDVGGGTYYGAAMKVIRNFYFPKKTFSKISSVLFNQATLPVYVMFVTDGETFDEAEAEKHIIESSHQPIFWQFMAIGNDKFKFLKKLDTLSGRLIDNANFFNVSNPDSIPDDKLYDLLMTEYPDWVKLAKNHKLIQ